MHALVESIRAINVGLFVLAAVLAFRESRRGTSQAGLWAALTFGALAAVAVAGRVLPDDPQGLAAVGERLVIGLLVLFPYLLYRFTAAFRESTARLESLVGVPTVLMVLWTFALPHVPSAGESRPAWFIAYLVAFMAHWTLLSVIVATRLWRAGRGQPSVARKRMRLLALAAVALTVAIFLAALGADEASAAVLATNLFATMSAVAFVLGLSPPAVLRTVWRRPEQRRLQNAVGDLMRATTESEVVERVLPPTAAIVGASAIALFTDDGRLVGTHGFDEASEADIEARGFAALGDSALRIEAASGAAFGVRVSPYAPFFGTDELALVRTLVALTELARDRARLFTQERDARAALERADAVKSRFIAFAAHELRTPVSSVVGIVETLERRADDLSPEQTAKLKSGLAHQARRMRVLVEQLLDLSRLDAEAVPIDPEVLRVRERTDEIVTAVAGERAEQIDVDVDPELEACVDPAAFDRIVSNLVANAVKYGEPPITIAAEQQDRHFRLTVEDRGAGVPSDFVPELFERFARGARATAAEGTGLGLAIARSYAQAHRGDLLYEPASPQGARFQLVLPCELAN